MKEELLEFEKKLLELRMEMTELLKKVNVDSGASDVNKLRQLEEELGYVIRQYRALEAKIKEPVIKQPIMKQQQPVIQQQPKVQQQHAMIHQTITPQKNDLPVQKKNVENAIGTSLMGILASGLIFISIILFATLGLPYLSDFLKMVTCYAVSIATIAVSMYKLNKQPESKFYLSLSGCGVGALYISLLLTNIYFGYINDIALFVCITIWVFFMCFLSKIKSKLFAVIGHVGIMIAVLFGVMLCAKEQDFTKFIMLTIFFLVSTATLYGVHFDKKLVKNIMPNVFAIISLFILMIGSVVIVDGAYHIYHIIGMVVIAGFMAVIIYCDWNDAWMSYGILLLVYVMLMLIVAGVFFDEDIYIGTFAYIISMVMIFVSEYKRKNHRCGMYFLQLFMIVIAWVGIGNYDTYEYILLPMMALPLICLGIGKKNSLCKYASMYVVFIFIFNDMDMMGQDNVAMMHKLILSLVAIIVLYVPLFINKESVGYRVALHIISIMFILAPFADVISEFFTDYDAASALIYVIMAVFNMIMFRVAYVKQESVVIYNIVNAILMAMGLSLISECTSLHILVIMVVIAAFMVNAKNYLDDGKLLPGIYVGIKFTILLLVILGSFETENYILSIMLILMAILSIIIGFACEYKALRVYGLGLAMISIFKLVMVDIHYDNTLGNAFSFFVSGVLCFAISMIYNYIGKRLER